MGLQVSKQLKTEAENPSSMMHKFKITITIRRLINKNKNPVGENANKEVLANKTGPVTTAELAIVTYCTMV